MTIANRSKELLKNYKAYILLLPAGLFYLIFWFLPVLQTVIRSITSSTGSLTAKFYLQVFSQGHFLGALLNTAYFALASVLIQFILAMTFAVVLNKKFLGSKLLLFLALIPMALPPMAIGIIWQTGLSTQGWVNSFLVSMNFIAAPINFLSVHGLSAILLLVIIDSWNVIPAVMVILFAGLQGLSKDYVEAAQVFGASRWRSFIDITMPMLKSTITTAMILRLVAALQVWIISVLIFGYGRVPFAVERIAYYANEVPLLENSSQIAATYSVIVTVVILVSTILYLKIARANKT